MNKRTDDTKSKPLAIFLMGPTASGKTDLALALRNQLPVDIISVDSALVYRGMDIGSAKPSREQQRQAPHRLMDIRDPAQPYSVAEFRKDALLEMAAIVAQGRIPLLVGGTMLYFKALLDGLSPLPSADANTRASIEAEAKQRGWPHIHAKLAAVDPESASRIHPHHSQRLCRAWEIYRLSGKTPTQLRKQQASATQSPLQSHYTVVQLALGPRNRSLLHKHIERRFEIMLERGFIEEVRALYQRTDVHAELPAMRAVGYRQVWAYLAGKVTWKQMAEQGKAATRQLAKRQLTWLRGWPDLHWIFTETETGNLVKLDEIVTQALNFVSKTAI